MTVVRVEMLNMCPGGQVSRPLSWMEPKQVFFIIAEHSFDYCTIDYKVEIVKTFS
jgi:hypothetical protein